MHTDIGGASASMRMMATFVQSWLAGVLTGLMVRNQGFNDVHFHIDYLYDGLTPNRTYPLQIIN